MTQVMPYYGMPIGTPYEEVGFGYNRGVITGLFREKYGFDGIVCTDWGLVTDHCVRRDGRIRGGPGASSTCPARSGCSGSSRRAATSSGVSPARPRGEAGRPDGRLPEARVDESVRRILREKFVLGLFDDPFVDPDAASGVVGAREFRAAGLAAQRASLTLLKNGPAGAAPGGNSAPGPGLP